MMTRHIQAGGLILLLMTVMPLLHAATYTSSNTTFNWIDPAAHTNVVWTAAGGGPPNECTGTSAAIDDDITQPLNLGFSFNFGGTAYTTVRVMSNGRLQFTGTYCGHGSQTTGVPRTYPFPMPDSRFANTLRVYGADLDPTAGGTVRYASLGSAPNRYFVVTWSNVPEWSSGGSSFNLQVILHEDGSFVYQYATIANPSQGHAQIGWEVASDDYEMRVYSSATALQNTAIAFSAANPAPLSYYAMDETTWTGAANEVRDSSGNGNHGFAVGSARPINPGYICNGGSIPGNNDAIDTNVNVVNTLGSRGTISFWLNNTSNWNQGTVLVADASANLGNNTADKYFFLVKRSDGQLRFVLEDSNDTDVVAETGSNNYAANSWHYVTLTWDLTEQTDHLQIYLDGVRRATSRGDITAPLALQDTLGALNSLYLGASRVNGIGGSEYTNSNIHGVFDETRLYNRVLSPSQILTDMNASHACLYGQWNMDQAAWNGTANEVLDSSGNNYHGTGINGVSTSNLNPAIAGSPGTCAYGAFDGSNDYVALANFPNLTGSFTITGWIRPNRINGDQRIFADDQSNSGGFAFSLGDGGNGRLRFFSRGVNPIIMDSGAVVTTGSWYHVAAVHDATAKTRQIFVNGAAATTAQTYTGTWSADNGTASIGGETNAAGSEAVAQWRFNGGIDEVRVFTRAMSGAEITSVMNETRACAIALDHIQIEHDGTGLTCEPESITVRACSNASCTLEYTGDISVTLTPAGWVGGDVIIISGGHTTVQLRHTAAGNVTVGTSTPSPSPSNATVCLNTATSGNDCNLPFYDTGFIYTIPTQTSCTTSATITVNAVRLDNTTQQCVPSFQNRSANVNFWSSYTSPATGTRTLTLNNGSSNYTLATASPGTSVPLTFNGSGQANVTLTYNDAGQLTLNSRFTGSGSEAGLIMNGATTYVTKPYKFYVYSDDANSDCAGAVPTCSAFKRAGESFNLKVRAACADNSVTPNFQLSGITLTHANIAPTINQGTLGVSTLTTVAADLGEHVTASEAVSEVGVFTFTAATPAGGYFGNTIGDATLNTSTYIGRFIPDHFCLSNNTLTNRTDVTTASGCTDGFNYLDEEFDLHFRLTAQRLGATCGDGSVTQNYSAAWSKFATPFNETTTLPNEAGKFNLAAVNDPGGAPTDLSSRIDINVPVSTPASGQFTNGIIDVLERLNINRAGTGPSYTAEMPFTSVALGIHPLDSDSVTVDSTNLLIGSDNYRQLGTTALYFGRLFAANAYGPETLPLSMWAQTQYCTAVAAGQCSAWSTKADDSCSLYSIIPPAATAIGNLSSGDGQGYYHRAAPAVSSGSYDFTAVTGRVHVPDTFNHSAGWQLFYTGGGNGGDYSIPFVSHPYLRTQPGTASFGQFRGDDRIIYWRELFQ
jgi:MSHA biogenesis protein MshQ